MLLLCASYAVENQTSPHKQVIEKVQFCFAVNIKCLGLTLSVVQVCRGWCLFTRPEITAAFS